MWLEITLVILYFGGLLGIFGYTLSLLHLAFGGSRTAATAPAGADLPVVTVQLPIYNEMYVVDELLASIAALEYPRELLEVQVLDDSTDETSAILQARVAALRAQGLDIHYLHRRTRNGFKAGALAEGLTCARGDLFAIFDADFRPREDFLTSTVGYFADPGIAAVQSRWAHLNEGASRLTRTAAMYLSLHLGFEQPRRYALGHFLNFNGTCGVWRRQAILAAGGWSARTVTEDIDLSYRAQLGGWRIVYLDDYATPGELPAEIAGFRTQQYRWLKGGAQNARLHLANVWRAPLTMGNRWHACHHLLAGSVFFFMFVTLLASTPLVLVKGSYLNADYGDYGGYFVLSTIGLGYVFFVSRESAPKSLREVLRFLGDLGLLLVFSLGLCLHFTRAVAAGWLGNGVEFVRTPKFGRNSWAGSRYTRASLDGWFALEVLFLIYLLAGLTVGWIRQEMAFYPLQLMAAAGTAWVLWLRIDEWLRSRRRSTPIVPEAL